MVTYHDGADEVQPGDRVEFNGGLLLLFRKLIGQVVYVPGISPRHPNMEFNGLQWIAIEVPGKALVKQVVDPRTGRLVRKVRLLERGPAAVTDAQRALLDRENDA